MKIFKIIQYIVTGFLFLIIVLLVISALPITGDYSFLIVRSGSMEPGISTGDLIIIKPFQEYKVGDIISFGRNNKTNDSVTHRIYSIETIDGKINYTTKGDANNAPDQIAVTQQDINGKVILDVPWFGYIIDFAKKPLGFVLIIIIPALVVIFDETKKIVKIMKKKNG